MSAPPRGRPRKNPNAKAGARLTALLRSPKTRAGLVASVADLGLDEWFVQGWLSTEVTAKRVIKVYMHREKVEMFVHCSTPHEVVGRTTNYPSWLEPAKVPVYSDRRLYSLGMGQPVQLEEQDQGHHENTRKRGRPAHR